MSKKEEQDQRQPKTCFIIMPIADHPDYSGGHFKRVYEYIIKPACEAADFKPVRADDVKVTNYIALDIIKQIIECDMAICDLSSRNPNVLYEVGIRQAFNLPVTFIKDKKTTRIFDIQGFRDVSYDESLRIDTVGEAIEELSETIKNTFEDKGGINSLISMLGIEPAKVSKKEISLDTELILNAINNIKIQASGPSENSKIFFPLTQELPFPEGAVQLLPSEIKLLQKGDVVFHKRYGAGKVRANDPGDRIVVDFQIKTGPFHKELVKFYKIVETK